MGAEPNTFSWRLSIWGGWLIKGASACLSADRESAVALAGADGAVRWFDRAHHGLRQPAVRLAHRRVGGE
jgi:hypothetical protein